MQDHSPDAYEEAVMSFIAELTTLGYLKPDTTIGCNDLEIQEIMKAQGVTRLPKIYECFLRKMGKQAGSFRYGDDFLHPYVLGAKEELLGMLEISTVATFQLPEQTFVFWMHQSYQFMYFPIDGNDDPKVFYWARGMQEPEEDFPLFSLLLTAWVDSYKRYRKNKNKG